LAPDPDPEWSETLTRQDDKLTRKEQRISGRAARLEAVQQLQRRKERRRTALIVIAVVVVVMVVVGVSWAVIGANSSSSKPAKAAALTGLTKYPGLARDHVTGKVTYPQTPPAGGKHSAVFQNCGVYTAPVPNENAVHSLEHGAMWITYRPGLSTAEISAILEDTAGQKYALVSPYPGLPSPVVATAWGVQMKLNSATDPRLKTFINTYKSGSEAPEPGGECTGGTGTPQG